jgi:hypothetical protein
MKRMTRRALLGGLAAPAIVSALGDRALASCSVTPPPGGTSGLTTPPPPAQAAGYTTPFYVDDFTYPDLSFLSTNGGTNGTSTWSSGLWWNPAGTAGFSKASPTILRLQNGATMDSVRNQAGPSAVGLSATGGYLELRALVGTAGPNLSVGYYFASLGWAQGVGTADQIATALDNQFGGVIELDTLETDPTRPNSALFTLHRAGVGSGQAGHGFITDQQNPNVGGNPYVDFPFPVLGVFHTFGCLWPKTPTDNVRNFGGTFGNVASVDFYLDNVLALSVPAYQSTFQPAFPIIANQGADDFQVDWFRWFR